jgi:hypothetical protein
MQNNHLPKQFPKITLLTEKGTIGTTISSKKGVFCVFFRACRDCGHPSAESDAAMGEAAAQTIATALGWRQEQ